MAEEPLSQSPTVEVGDTTTTTATTTTIINITATASNTTSEDAAPSPPPVLKHTQDLNYMHRPPRIVPNYGKRPHGVLPKSNVSRVLLYDNVTQEQMLHVKMTHLKTEQRKTGRLMDLHRKSFIIRRLIKQKHRSDTVVDHHTQLSELTITNNTGVAAAVAAAASGGDSHHHRKARGAKRNRKDDEGEKAIAKVKEWNDSRLTPRRGEEGGGKENEEGGGGGGVSLPSIDCRKLQGGGGGSSTSQGFAVGHPSSSSVRQARQRKGLRTASTAGQREGHNSNNSNNNTILPDIISPRTSEHRAADVASSSLHTERGVGGLTRLGHTFPPSSQHRHREGGKAKGREGRGEGEKAGVEGVVSERTTEDERYRKLERLLVRIKPPNDGYLELSPSFHLPRKTMTFTRPSSFHSSLFRRSSSSSLSPPGPVLTVGSLSSVVWI